MEKEQFEKLVESVREGAKILNNKKKPSRSFKIEPNRIRLIRIKHNLTQDKFAELLGISVGTLKNWEQGRRKPTGPASVLLSIAEKNPDVIFNNF
ncbi:MAG: helix-turn-helix domain-containing protein [Candidatus Kapabacteria bacterium]|nr:helix-turn-helix domain-containing protein [Candidatus Kapabacteria bacterium]